MPDDTPSPARPTGKGSWRESDVRRAIGAAEKAGLHRYRVEIAPDGTISIVVGADAEVAAGAAGSGT